MLRVSSNLPDDDTQMKITDNPAQGEAPLITPAAEPDLEKPVRAPKASEVNWSAVFAAYCNGGETHEIAEQFGISHGSLITRANKESWKGLRLSMPLVTSIQTPDGLTAHGSSAHDLLPVEVKSNINAVRENRERNLEAFIGLQEDLLDTVKSLRAGTLMTKKAFKLKDEDGNERVEVVEIPIGLSERAILANYALAVANGTYRALGDSIVEGKTAGAGNDGNPLPPAITIILPGVIAKPRDEREMRSAATPGEVIDLR